MRQAFQPLYVPRLYCSLSHLPQWEGCHKVLREKGFVAEYIANIDVLDRYAFVVGKRLQGVGYEALPLRSRRLSSTGKRFSTVGRSTKSVVLDGHSAGSEAGRQIYVIMIKMCESAGKGCFCVSGALWGSTSFGGPSIAGLRMATCCAMIKLLQPRKLAARTSSKVSLLDGGAQPINR